MALQLGKLREALEDGTTSEKAAAAAEEVASYEGRLTGIEVRLERLDGKIDRQGIDLSGKIDRQGAELSGKIDRQGIDLSGKIDRQGAELSGKIDRQGAELSGKIDRQGADLAGKIETLRVEVGSLRTEMRAVSGLIVALILGVLWKLLHT